MKRIRWARYSYGVAPLVDEWHALPGGHGFVYDPETNRVRGFGIQESPEAYEKWIRERGENLHCMDEKDGQMRLEEV